MRATSIWSAAAVGLRDCGASPASLLRGRVEAVTGNVADGPRKLRHLIWKPVNLRLVEEDRGEPLDLPTLHADALVDHEVPVAHAGDCMWQALWLLEAGRPFPKAALPDISDAELASLFEREQAWTAESERRYLEDYVLPFIDAWGVMISIEDDVVRVMERGGLFWLDEWLETAQQLYDVLAAVAATEAGELIAEDVLWRIGGTRLSHNDRRAEHAIRHQYIEPRLGRGASLSDLFRKADTEVLNYWRGMRAQGRGLQLQRDAIVDALNSFPHPRWFQAAWDDSGRRVILESIGWDEIAAAHLMELFASTEPDVYLCSTCGKPFPLPAGRRRPREGAARFCSEACRHDARRAANRASWHRHKYRWRGRDGE